MLLRRQDAPLPILLAISMGFYFTVVASNEVNNFRKSSTGGVDLSDLGFTSTLEHHSKAEVENDALALKYQPIFNTLSKLWYGKQQANLAYLTSNHPARKSIDPGSSNFFTFPLNELLLSRTSEAPVIPIRRYEEDLKEYTNLELRKRNNGPYEVHITLSVCRQPSPLIITDDAPPGLDLRIISPSSKTQGPKASNSEVHKLTTEEGFAHVTDQFSEEIHIEVHAPELENYHGTYTYELTASIDYPYSSYNDFHSLRHIDSDHYAGMFTTVPLADARTSSADTIDRWMQAGRPFSLFIHDRDDPQILGVRRSYCGLAENAEIHTDSLGVKTEMTKLGGDAVQQQFYMPGLYRGASYHAILGLPSNFSKRGAGTPTGGGMLWRPIEFRANSNDSCQIVSNLNFCDKVNYAVPSPANNSVNSTQLGQVYDSFASQAFQNFSFSLQQIACNTDPASQYSLATNCSACNASYHDWICAVSIPRCADAGANSTGLIPRNASDAGRSQFLNTQIQPGLYSELPPCGNLCFGLVQHCPFILGFACPYPNTWYFNQSYGYQGKDISVLNCNPYGDPSPYGLNAARSLQLPIRLLFTAIIVAITMCEGIV